MERHRPQPTRFSKGRVNAFAESVASRLGFEPGEPIEPLVSRLGGNVEYKGAETSEDRQPESIIVRSAENFSIYLPFVTSYVRDRFTIAHELGHLFLHYPVVAAGRPDVEMVATRWVDKSNPDLQRCEWEANWFAAGLLMPSGAFTSSYAKHGGDLDLVASDFAVSLKAAEIRARSLCL